MAGRNTTGHALSACAYADDERIIELAWNVKEKEPDLIVYVTATGKATRTESAGSSHGPITVPPFWRGLVTPGHPVPGSVFVPTECDDTAAGGDSLRADIGDFINRYVELPADTLPLVVEYVLFTWVFDAFDELPYLIFRAADKGTGKSRALESVGALCYRPFFAGGGSTVASTLRLIHLFGGTLIADEYDHDKHMEFSSVLTAVLNQGFQRNRPICKCEGDQNTPRAYRCFGPKVFASRRSFGDDATESRALVVYMKPRTRDDIPLNVPRRQFDAEALALRNRLLAWRFKNLGRVSIDPGLAVEDLEDRINQIGLPLLSMARNSEVRQQIEDALRAQQDEITAELSESLPGQIFQILLEDYKVGDLVRPQEIATKYNLRNNLLLPGQGLTPAKVGRILKYDLGLPRTPRDQRGTLYRLELERMRRLAVKYGVPLDEPTHQPTQLAPPGQPGTRELTQPTSEPTLPPTPEKRGLEPANGG